MEVKKYSAKSIQEAISRIKEDLGPEAMILSTRRLPRGVRDPYRAEAFEVTAARPNVLADSAKAGGEHPDCEMDTIGQSLRSFISPDAPALDSRNRWEAVRAELFSIKDMLFLIHQAGGLPDFLHMHPECLNLYSRLVKAGISERRAQTFIKKGGAFSKNKTFGPEELVQRVLKEILSSISVLNPFESENGARHLAAFVGPTGVGKTTTIAKLAADLSLKQKKSVGIISVDSYRIGAVEQLKTYAAIMGLPCLPAFSKQDLEMAVKKMKNKDIILIDTAGHSHLDKDRIIELSRFMESDLSISSHLVLSSTINRDDMKEAAENFSMLNPKTYVFTKVDETRRRGSIIDQIQAMKLPISFITNGQRVPEDIRPASKRGVLRLILS